MATQETLNPGESFELTLLGESHLVGSGSVIEMVGPHLRVQVPMKVAFGNAVKIECRDLMILGDVCHCAPNADGYVLTITARHLTAGLPGLHNLYSALGPSNPVTETVEAPVPSVLKPATN